MDCLNANLCEITKLLKELLEQTSAVRVELEELKGYGMCNSLSDIGDKLDGIECSLADASCKD